MPGTAQARIHKLPRRPRSTRKGDCARRTFDVPIARDALAIGTPASSATSSVSSSSTGVARSASIMSTRSRGSRAPRREWRHLAAVLGQANELHLAVTLRERGDDSGRLVAGPSSTTMISVGRGRAATKASVRSSERSMRSASLYAGTTMERPGRWPLSAASSPSACALPSRIRSWSWRSARAVGRTYSNDLVDEQPRARSLICLMVGRRSWANDSSTHRVANARSSSTINPRDRPQARDWQTHGPTSPRRSASPRGVRCDAGERLLEIGCGEGANLFHLRELAGARFGNRFFVQEVPSGDGERR